MRWFARGKLWASREAERDDFQQQRQAATAPRPRNRDDSAPERRGTDWRPGGAHKDPRDRFKKKNRPERAWSEKDPATQRDRDKPGYAANALRRPHDDRRWQDKQRGDQRWSKMPPAASEGRDKPRGDERRPWTGKPRDTFGTAPGVRPDSARARKPPVDHPAPYNDRPWQKKPTGPRAQRQPWHGKPSGDRGWKGKPSGPPSQSGRPWDKRGSAPRGDRPPNEKRPWTGKPRGDKPDFKTGGAPHAGQPWRAKNRPAAGAKRPWIGKPGRPSSHPRKRRDDEPPDRD